MGWIEGISEAIRYIEENITEELSIEEIAKQAAISPFYFQKGFAMLCGFTVGEYIRQRRLSLAGSELISTQTKIIDIAMKYGYESPDSFTKAFTRFHGVTPTAVRKEGAVIKSFAPLRMKFSLEGGNIMEYKIVEKEAFTVMGVSKMFETETAKQEITKFWAQHYQEGKGEIVCGIYGVCLGVNMPAEQFEYVIADNYIPWKEVPDGCVTKVIPKHTWVVFPCVGAIPQSIHDVNTRIYSEWLPTCKDYEIADSYMIELYSNPCDYPKGNQDEHYYSEIWIPVKKR